MRHSLTQNRFICGLDFFYFWFFRGVHRLTHPSIVSQKFMDAIKIGVNLNDDHTIHHFWTQMIFQDSHARVPQTCQNATFYLQFKTIQYLLVLSKYSFTIICGAISRYRSHFVKTLWNWEKIKFLCSSAIFE